MCQNFNILDTIGKLQFAYSLMGILQGQLQYCLRELVGAFGLADNLHYPDIVLERLRRAIRWQINNIEELLRTRSLLCFFKQPKFCTLDRLKVQKRYFACYCHAAFAEWSVVTGYNQDELLGILERWRRMCAARLLHSNLWGFSDWDRVQYLYWCFNMYDCPRQRAIFQQACTAGYGWLNLRHRDVWPYLERSSLPREVNLPLYTPRPTESDSFLRNDIRASRHSWMSRMKFRGKNRRRKKFPLAVVKF